jgi:GMP synthase-like glutamine amidotransferase
MNIHYFQHESFEDVACINYWADKPGNKLSCTKFFERYTLPDINSIDMLIILGGPMGIYEEDKYPWLKEEKKFIAQAIQKNKKVVGICLGSQLIAEVLGARVYKNKEKEIGWFEIEMTEEAKTNKFFKDIPSPLYVFHWHGDTFDLPEGATHIAQSKACKNQAFTYGNNVIALQFHMEATKKSIKELAFNCKEELIEGPYIQKEKDIISNEYRTDAMNLLMYDLLDKL